MDMSQFCTCKDRACPLHPTNHDKGCTPCIAKNRKQGEIPDESREGYTFRDFAELVLESES